MLTAENVAIRDMTVGFLRLHGFTDFRSEMGFVSFRISARKPDGQVSDIFWPLYVELTTQQVLAKLVEIDVALRSEQPAMIEVSP